MREYIVTFQGGHAIRVMADSAEDAHRKGREYAKRSTSPVIGKVRSAEPYDERHPNLPRNK